MVAAAITFHAVRYNGVNQLLALDSSRVIMFASPALIARGNFHQCGSEISMSPSTATFMPAAGLPCNQLLGRRSENRRGDEHRGYTLA